MTDKEAISNLNQIYGFVSSEIQQSLDLAIKALEEKPQGEWKIIEHETLYLMGIYQCNLCSYKYTCPDEFARNYCPNCGAKMSNSV